MTRRRAACTAAALAAFTLAGCGNGPNAPGSCPGVAPPGTDVLLFTRTTGYRHESIPTAVAAVLALGQRYGFTVQHTEDPLNFTDERLAPFDAVVFLHTTGDVLDASQQAAFERFMRGGGGFAGVHAAADTEYEWPWYGKLVGAWFLSHPEIQSAQVVITDTLHPATRCVPAVWTRTDEWYDFRAQPATVTVVATLDESSYEGGRMGAQHPVAWHHAFEGGRAWYTAMGHTVESWSDRAFLDHVAGGILWAAMPR